MLAFSCSLRQLRRVSSCVCVRHPACASARRPHRAARPRPPTPLCRAMSTIKNLGSTGIYAYTTLISVFICAPGVLLFERGVWEAIKQQVAEKGATQFYGALLSVGLFYHLYNQFAFNTLARVSPVSHGVCNVVKRVAIIATSGERPSLAACLGASPSPVPACVGQHGGARAQGNLAFCISDRLVSVSTSRLSPAAPVPPAVLFFGNKLTMQTQVGTAIALLGTWLYTETTKKKPGPKTA